MALTKVRSKGQITIPTEIREAARLEEGTVIEVSLTDAGILIEPKAVVDAKDAWFFSPGWQEGEREASAELAAGEGEVYESDQDFLDALDANRD